MTLRPYFSGRPPVILQLLVLLIVFVVPVSCTTDEEPLPENGEPGYTQYGTPFENMPATEDIVMYEVNLRAFSQGGDLQGVIDGLDHIQSLGVNVIWLMPIHPQGELNSVGSPYSVRDFKAVGDEYGTLEDLRTLTTEAHSRDMAVIMDWVANHTAWDHPWIENPTWYTRDEEGNIVHPPGTNWHDVADLNFDNYNMRAAMIDAMKYWILEANVDGYRCDYADGVPFDFWQQAIDTLLSIPGRELVMLAEGDRDDHFAAGFDLNFGWAFYWHLKQVFEGEPAGRVFTINNAQYTYIPQGKSQLRFTTNHDESAWDATPVVLFNGLDGALAASVVNTFLGGVPLLYSSQEVGRENNVPFFSNSSINWDKNPGMLQAYQDMMSFYNSWPPARQRSHTSFPHEDIVIFTKSSGNQQLLVIVNVRNNAMGLEIPGALQNTTWTSGIDQSPLTLEESLHLEAYQWYVLKREVSE